MPDLSDLIDVPEFPDVPDLPGVPQLARLPGIPAGLGSIINASSTSLLASSTAILASFAGGSILGSILQQAIGFDVTNWGVFDSDGILAIDPDSIVDFDFRKEYRLSDFPVEEGQIATYNKVLIPYDSAVRLRKGGSLADRTQFHVDCETVVDSFDLYSILTPEKRYTNVNCVRMEVSRKGIDGAYVLEVDLFFRLVQSVTAQYSNTAAANSANPDGSINPTSPVAPNTSNAQSPAAMPIINQGASAAITPTGQQVAGGTDAIGNSRSNALGEILIVK